MKAEFTVDGFIKISAETITEAFAMQHILPKKDDESCSKCGRQYPPLIIDTRTPPKED